MTEPANVLVTGGAGYIGSHTCKALAKSGFRPVVYDDLSTGHEWAVKWGPLIRGNISDTAFLTDTIQSCRPVAVLHFAAHIEVGESVKDPLKFYRNNVGGTLSLLAAMAAAKLDRFIFSSSCAIYGMADDAVLTEACPHNPVSPYGHTKSMVERALADLAAHKKIRYAALRYFNASGADPDGDTGEAHKPETHLIPLAIAAAQGGAPLRIFGEDFPTPDGTAIRDYTHVCDLAAAHVKALEYLLAGKESAAFNVGSGKGASVLEVIAGLRQIGLEVKTQKAGRRAGDPARLVADVGLANRQLGWRAEMSDLPGILKTAAAWHRKDKPGSRAA